MINDLNNENPSSPQLNTPKISISFAKDSLILEETMKFSKESDLNKETEKSNLGIDENFSLTNAFKKR